jgi:sulfur carrier protein ThiS
VLGCAKQTNAGEHGTQKEEIIMTTTTIKLGQMPGIIREFAVETSTTFAELIALGELSASGFEVKADGVTVTDFNAPVGETKLVLLAKLIKGNADVLVKVGMMPGKISEIAVDSSASIAQLLEMAELNPDGMEVKVDGTKVTDLSTPIGNANLVLLTKLIKGNFNA